MNALRVTLLWSLALIFLGLVSLGITLYFAYPLWASLAIFLGLLGLYVLARTSRRLLLAWRSRSIIARQRRVEENAVHLRSPRGELRRKFRDAIDRLRSSSLKRLGNPLYVLPWYMVVGLPGAGKTTALARSRLATQLNDETKHGVPVPQTQNCDCWYFDRSIILDCAGRYFETDNLESDRREWDILLDLLFRYRSREGINGMVMTISADRLLDPQREELEAEGRVIRTRIEQMIRLFGRRFPVYVLVTKCDRLYGFERLSEFLPQNVLDQAMGHLAPEDDDERPARAFLDSAFDTIAARLRALRLGLIAQHPKNAIELLLFPNELEQLRNGVDLFVTACLCKSPYLESPILRGLFFSSGVQEGGARSTILPDTLRPSPIHQSKAVGVFLHDLFGRILPYDRNASRPAALVNRWLATTQHLGMLAWFMLALAVGLLITMSFIRNVRTLQEIQATYPFHQQFDGLLSDDAAALTRVSDSIRTFDRRDRSWSSRWMVQDELDDLLQAMHRRYVDQYLRFIRPIVQRDFDPDPKQFRINDRDDQFPIAILNEIRTTNLLKARFAGADLARLTAMPQPLYSDLVSLTPELFQQLNQLQISYIAWSPINAHEIIGNIQSQQVALDGAMYGDHMRWLTKLAPFNPHLKDLKLADLWLDPAETRAQSIEIANSRAQTSAIASIGRRVPAGKALNIVTPEAIGEQKTTALQVEQLRLAAVDVPAAYTRAGKTDIDDHLSEVRDAVDDIGRLNEEIAIFQKQYEADRFENWLTFVQHLPEGERMLAGHDAWRDRLATITDSSSPYMRTLQMVNDEFDDVDDKSLPGWLQTARRLSRLRRDATGAHVAGEAGWLLQSINSFGGKAIKLAAASDAAAGAESIRNTAQGISALHDYFETVNEISATVADGTGKAYGVSADFHGFGVDPAIRSSLVHDAARALALARIDIRAFTPLTDPSEQAVWNLMGGPLHFVLAYTEEETSCALQSEWNTKVYWPLQSATSTSQATEQIYGPQGSVWVFVDGFARPFLRRSPTTISVVDTAGYSVPFAPGFLPMLNSGIGKRVAQLTAAQKVKARTEADEAQAQAGQDQARQQQANAEQALADLKQRIATTQARTYPLTIAALPVDVNSNAKLRPFETVLTVQCASGAHVLTNFNFPASDTFDWTLRQCGEVTLLIRFDGLTLTRRYRGEAGVVSFLHDFRDGHRLFTPADFPSSADSLTQHSIEQIDVHYEFRGEDAIITGAQELDELEDQQHQKTRVRQQAIDSQAARIQQLLLIKTAGANDVPEMPSRIAVPQQIGTCWTPPTNPDDAATLQHRFDSLLDSRSPLMTAAPPPPPSMTEPEPMTAPPLPSLPTLPPLPPLSASVPAAVMSE